MGSARAAGAKQDAGETKPMDETRPTPPPVAGDAPAAPPIETTQAAPPDLAKITIDQFMAVDLRVADIRAAERLPKSKKLMKLPVFTGHGGPTTVAGIATK